MIEREPKKNPHRSLLVSILFGGFIFVLLLFVLQFSLVFLAGGHGIDPSFVDFYPLMGGLGAFWGFERWWSYEGGEYNPFHSR